MYQSHFGMRLRPFRSSPHSDCYYPATGQEQALARLLQGLADQEGVLVLTGGPGTGKTLLCHCLLNRLGEEVASAFLTNSHFPDRGSMLQAILYELGQPYEKRSEQELRLAITDLLLTTFAAGRRTILLVDEAQHLSIDLLEELRLLGNLEAGQGKALQIVLVGQPALLERVRGPELAILNQRLAVRASLEALPVHEAADYLVCQLRTAGTRPERVLTDEALGILAQGTRGVPRLLNQAAHQALLLAHAAGAAHVDAEAALEALTILGLEVEAPDTSTLPLPPERRAESLVGAAESQAGPGATDHLHMHRLFPPPLQPA